MVLEESEAMPIERSKKESKNKFAANMLAALPGAKTTLSSTIVTKLDGNNQQDISGEDFEAVKARKKLFGNSILLSSFGY